MLFRSVNSPNDILGLSYIKEIKKQKSNIKPITIKRTSNYKSIELNKKIVSALSIREAIKNKISIENFVPKYSLKFIDTNINMDNEQFSKIQDIEKQSKLKWSRLITGIIGAMII